MSETTPFRFGVLEAPQDASTWPALARRLENLGYDTLLTPDRAMLPSPVPMIAAAAAVTSVLRVGTWVFSAPLRTPGHLARDAQTLQSLSGGRLELGLGAGMPGGAADARALSMPWGTARERVDQVGASLAAIATLDPAPRILLAAGGPRMLALARKYAATVALPLEPAADRPAAEAAAARTRDLAGEVELAVQLSAVGDEVLPWVAGPAGLTATALRDRQAVGIVSADPAQAADQLLGLRADTGISYLLVPALFADRLAPVVARLRS